MDSNMPTASEVRATLARLGHAQIQELARVSGVPFNTLWNIRGDKTRNPGIETVRKFLPHVAAVVQQAAA